MPHKLLLADDSVTIQRVIELTFADEDVQVIAVGNGQEAIDRVQRDRPDIVLADVGMPERNGYEVAAFIKGNPATAHIPVVLLTGAFEPVDEGRARSAGCDGVLVKPFEPQIVISRVKDLLAGRAPSGMWSAPPVAQGPVRKAPAEADIRPGPAAPASSDPLEAYFDRLDAAFASTGTTPAADPFAAIAPPASAPAPPAPQRREVIPMTTRPVPGAPPAAKGDPFADWDPDLKGDPSRTTAAAPPAPKPFAAPPAPAAAAPPPPAAAPPAPVAAAPPPPAAPITAPLAPRPAAPAAVAPPAASASAPPPVAPAPTASPAPAAPAPAPLPASLVDAFAALLAAEQRMGLSPSAATAPAAPRAADPAPLSEDTIEIIATRVLARLTDQSRPTILDVAERLVREEIERIKQNS